MLPFYGDVRELHYSVNNPYKKTNTGFSLEINKNLSSVFGVKADVISGGLSGSSPNLNLHFNTNLLEYSVSGFLNVNNLISFYPQKEKMLNFYLFAGVGLVDYRSKVFSFDENTFINGYGWSSDGQSKTKRIAEIVYPFGVSVKYKADPKVDIGLEMSLHPTSTDKLDAWVVKDSYKDRYGYAAIFVTIKLGGKSEYVDWVNPFQDTTNVFAHNPDDKPNVPLASNSTVATNNSSASTTKQNDTKTNQLNKKTSVDTVKTVVAPVIVKNYFVVSSAYKTKKLAKEALAKLKNKGFSDAEILIGGKSTIYRVAVKSFVTLDEAADRLNSIKKAYPYAKIFEKKNNDFTEISIKTINSKNQNNADTSKTNSSKTNLTQNTNTSNTNKNSTVATTNKNTNNSANNSSVTNKTNPNTTTNTTTNQTTANTNVKTNNTAVNQNNGNSGTTTNQTNTNTANNTKPNNSTNTSTNQTTTNNNVKTNNTPTTTNPTTNTNAVKTNTTTSNATVVVKKFYIIAASFPTEQEANDAVLDLKTKGFSEAEVVGKNAAGGIRICYKGYATKEDALTDLPAIKQSTNPSAWIFEKK